MVVWPVSDGRKDRSDPQGSVDTQEISSSVIEILRQLANW